MTMECKRGRRFSVSLTFEEKATRSCDCSKFLLERCVLTPTLLISINLEDNNTDKCLIYQQVEGRIFCVKGEYMRLVPFHSTF